MTGDDDIDFTPRCELCHGDPESDPANMLINGANFCGPCCDRLVRVGVLDEALAFVPDTGPQLPPVDPALQPVIDALPPDERAMWDGASKSAGSLMLLNGPELYRTGMRLLAQHIGGGERLEAGVDRERVHALPLELVKLGDDSMFPGMPAIRRMRPPTSEIDLLELEAPARQWNILVRQLAYQDNNVATAAEVLQQYETLILMAPRARDRAYTRGALLRRLVQRIAAIARDTDGLYEEVVDEYDAACSELGLKRVSPDDEGQPYADARAFRAASAAGMRQGLDPDVVRALDYAADQLQGPREAESDSVIEDEAATEAGTKEAT